MSLPGKHGVQCLLGGSSDQPGNYYTVLRQKGLWLHCMFPQGKGYHWQPLSRWGRNTPPHMILTELSVLQHRKSLVDTKDTQRMTASSLMHCICLQGMGSGTRGGKGLPLQRGKLPLLHHVCLRGSSIQQCREQGYLNSHLLLQHMRSVLGRGCNLQPEWHCVRRKTSRQGMQRG